MLTKSQARLFFLGGTALFSLVFLLLTVDTIRQVPKQTNQKKLTDAVKRGKHIWDENNCMGCHTLLGEGAYYAPELTKVYDRRGPLWMKIFLKDPQAMFPGERKMTNYHFKDKQIDDLIAFFKWIGEMDLNGYPATHGLKMKAFPNSDKATKVSKALKTSKVKARPTTSPSTKSTTRTAQKVVARPATFSLCIACHQVEGKGGKVGPSLDRVGTKFDKKYLYKWLKDPQSVKKGTTMPKLPLAEKDINQLVEYLSSLR